MNHIERSGLGRLKVADVRRADVQSLADELLASGLAPGTVSNVLNPIQALYRRLIDRDLMAHNLATRIDLPAQGSARPKRIGSAAEAAQLIAPLRDEEQAVWAAAFYAGLRRGELQGSGSATWSWAPASSTLSWLGPGGGADRAEIGGKPADDTALAVLRDHLDEHLLRTGRTGDERCLARTAVDPFVPSTIDNHSQECWAAVELRAHHAARGAAHLRLPSDRLGCERKGGAGVHGAFEDPDHLRHLRAPAAGLPRRGPRADGCVPARRDSGAGADPEGCSVSV